MFSAITKSRTRSHAISYLNNRCSQFLYFFARLEIENKTWKPAQLIERRRSQRSNEKNRFGLFLYFAKAKQKQSRRRRLKQIDKTRSFGQSSSKVYKVEYLNAKNKLQPDSKVDHWKKLKKVQKREKKRQKEKKLLKCFVVALKWRCLSSIRLIWGLPLPLRAACDWTVPRSDNCASIKSLPTFSGRWVIRKWVSESEVKFLCLLWIVWMFIEKHSWATRFQVHLNTVALSLTLNRFRNVNLDSDRIA